MKKQTETPVRKIDLPRRSAKQQSLLNAATEVFCREGFSGACIDDIAERAKISRQTVYNHYREKEALFIAVVEDTIARVDVALMATVSAFPKEPDDMAADLTDFAAALAHDCLYSHDGRFLRKLFQSEGDRYPDLFDALRRQSPGAPAAAIEGLLIQLKAEKGLDIDDPALAARQFLALLNVDLQTTAALGGQLSKEEMRSAAENAVRTFLRAYPQIAGA
jgi:AcrR family transcriptional regulator